ncbi:MAG: hypothetical protein ABI867_19585 [Kofleriaceae bacterium]
MKRWIVALAIVCGLVQPASAHVGSPDVFFEGDAGPYRLFVSIRTPDVIPGIATIEIRTDATDVTAIAVVPMRLTGAGSQLPPTPDAAERSAVDPKFFTASLWLMERGSLQVRVTVEGARGTGTLAIPVPAVAQRTLAMDRGLGALLFGLMLVLVLAVISILAGAIREARLEPGVLPTARDHRRSRIALVIAGVIVTGVVVAGNAWWNLEADTYDRMIAKPWNLALRRDGCTITVPKIDAQLLPDHGHDMHLFVVRVPVLDQLAHLHPTRLASGELAQQLPSLPAGRYRVFADIVVANGFPVTGTGELELPELTCPALAGDDSAWHGSSELGDGLRMIWDHPQLHANQAARLEFRVEAIDGSAVMLEPYMGMAGHAAIVRVEPTVFAHLHPAGTIAMPALDLARGGDPHAGHVMPVASTITFPYGFPQAGSYRVFVQVKHAGHVLTGAFTVEIAP